MKYILPAIFIIILIVFLLTNRFWQYISGGITSFFKTFNTTSSSGWAPNITPPKWFTEWNWGGDSYYIGTNTSDFKKEEFSPFYKKVVIESVKINSNPKYEEIILAAAQLTANQNIDITGWSIVSNKNYFVITTALKELDFKKVFQQNNIFLKSGEKVKIYSTISPINVNFKGNQCIGYLNNNYDFVPKLPQNCPDIVKRDIAHLNGLCQEFILKLNKCELPVHPPIEASDVLCLNYLKNINYQGCFEKNKNNSNFDTKEWYIFMGREILDDLHDKVLLFDRSGKVVDEYLY